MEQIGSFEAKTRLSELLERVSRGESFLITRHGHPVARLVPDAARGVEQVRAALDRLRSLRGTLGGQTIEQLKRTAHEGHRH
ncbi:MAG: type II toxin-antitoxin system prevent-host-death family antitoxin [Phycisphaerales bacterium]